MYGEKRTVYDVRCKTFSVRCTVYHVQCTMHGVPRTVKVNICKNGSVNFDKFINSPLIHNLMAVLKNTITLHVNALLFILLY